MEEGLETWSLRADVGEVEVVVVAHLDPAMKQQAILPEGDPKQVAVELANQLRCFSCGQKKSLLVTTEGELEALAWNDRSCPDTLVSTFAATCLVLLSPTGAGLFSLRLAHVERVGHGRSLLHQSGRPVREDHGRNGQSLVDGEPKSGLVG